jgi:peptidylprolyl isomerase
MKSKKGITLMMVLSLMVLLTTGCNPDKKWQKQEDAEIQNYLNSIGDTVYIKKPSGLYYFDLTVGTGISPVINDTVSIKYKGSFLTGEIFGSNYPNYPDTTMLRWIVGSGAILPGMDEGVRYMKAGGKAKMLLPSSLAYGPNGWQTIPGYTPLLFEVQLVKVAPVTVKK